MNNLLRNSTALCGSAYIVGQNISYSFFDDKKNPNKYVSWEAYKFINKLTKRKEENVDKNVIGDLVNNNHKFYKKKLLCRGLEIKGSKKVDDKSFYIACDRLQRMLRHSSENVTKNLIKNDVGFNLIAKSEQMTDLPEHCHMKDVKGGYSGRGNMVNKCRGMRHGQNVFCGEENLIQQGLKTEYSPNIKDIFIHETSHAIMGDGLDGKTQEDINKVFKDVKSSNNLWKKPNGKNAYALSNSKEYFAELSMWLFGGHGDYANIENKIPKPGPGGLSEYDNDGFKLICDIYNGTREIPLDVFKERIIQPIVEISKSKEPDEIFSRMPSSKNGPPKNKKVTLSFQLKNKNDDSEYLVSWINYKGEKRWGFLINKDCPKFNTSTFVGHAWLIEKNPKDGFFQFVKAFVAEDCEKGICLV